MRIQQKAVLLAGVSYFLMAIFHIPDQAFPHGFDKNAPVQFFSLLVTSALLGIFIAFRSERFHFPKFIVYSVSALLLAQLASLLASGNLVGSLFGDAGRFVGLASVIALFCVATFHTQFNFSAFLNLIKLYVIAIEVVVSIGIAQHYEFIVLPGDQGVTSTLGNTDFFAAYVGTTLPFLFLWGLNSQIRTRLVLTAMAAINLCALWLAGPLQGFLDVIFVAIGFALWGFRKHIPRIDMSLNKRNFIAVAALAIWIEIIFLMPFLGKFVPVLGDDPQVQIRSNFWLAGMRQFFSQPLLGVGPDQYGYYYEQFRTVDDAQRFANILSNDAHSASVQTLATLGILGSLAYLLLLGLTFRAFLVLWDSQKIARKNLFAIGIFIFVYLTNSFISPITLTHKFLLWAVCGFILGNVYKYPSWKSLKLPAVKIISLATGALMLTLATFFAQGQLNFLTKVEEFATSKLANSSYVSSPVLPCYMYFEMEYQIVGSGLTPNSENLANDKLARNPRCVAALISNTRKLVNAGEVDSLKSSIYRLFEIAPARADAISLGMYYANRTGDSVLKREIEKQMKLLGLVYIPGQLG